MRHRWIIALLTGAVGVAGIATAMPAQAATASASKPHTVVTKPASGLLVLDVTAGHAGVKGGGRFLVSTVVGKRLVTVETGRFAYAHPVKLRLAPGDYVVDVVTVADSSTIVGKTTDITTVVRQAVTRGEVVRSRRATRLHVVTV